MKLVFFGTSPVAVPILRALHGAPEYQIAAVVTAPDAPVGRKQIMTPSPVAETAGELGLTVLKPEQVKNNQELLDQLQTLGADIFIVVSYGKILPAEVIDLPRLKTLNIHFSRLPQYRGAAPIQWALINGDNATATTIFVLDRQMDHGLIVAQEETPILPDDTFDSLSVRMAKQSAQLLLKVLPDYAEGKIELREQDHAQATPTGIIAKADGRIDWTQPAEIIYNRYRALKTWPGIWTQWNGKILKVLGCKPLPGTVAATEKPGTVIQVPESKAIAVICGNGTALELLTIQVEGQKPTDSGSLVNGHAQFIGSILD